MCFFYKNMSTKITALEDYMDRHGLHDYIYPHQKDAIEWLYYRCLNKKGAVLSDDLGLGKTLVASVLLQLIQANFALVVAPTTLVYTQWVRNLCQHSFYYRVYVVKSHEIVQVIVNSEGNILESDPMPFTMLYSEPHIHKVVICNFHAVVPFPGIADRNGMTGNKYETNQPIEIYDPELTPFNDIVWDVVIVDEIHSIRNGVNTQLDPSEKRKKMLRYYRLSRLRMNPNGGIRIGMTGTLIQNRISDSVSALTFVGYKFSPACTSVELKKVIREYVFRRTKDNLHPALCSLIKFPELPYEEIIKDVIYESQAEADIYRIVAGSLTGNNIPGAHLNPYSQVQYEDNPIVRCNRECYLSASINMFVDIHNKKYPTIHLPYWYGSESKMNMMMSDLVSLSLDNNSIIVFIHYFAESALIAQKMHEKSIELGMEPNMGYRRFDINGGIQPKDRDYIVKESEDWIKSGKKCICFASIDTCCDGLNLQHFNVITFPTSNWNPQKELQCIGRLQRNGQRRLVRIYRYIHRYIVDAEGTKHIDVKKIDKKNIKKEKFAEFVTDTPNAAHDWPIRDMPGFPGEKCVTFPVEDNSLYSLPGYEYPIIPTPGGNPNYDESNIAKLVDSFYQPMNGNVDGMRPISQGFTQEQGSLPFYHGQSQQLGNVEIPNPFVRNIEITSTVETTIPTTVNNSISEKDRLRQLRLNFFDKK